MGCARAPSAGGSYCHGSRCFGTERAPARLYTHTCEPHALRWTHTHQSMHKYTNTRTHKCTHRHKHTHTGPYEAQSCPLCFVVFLLSPATCHVLYVCLQPCPVRLPTAMSCTSAYSHALYVCLQPACGGWTRWRRTALCCYLGCVGLLSRFYI